MRRTRDGSIVHADGRILFFSISRFVKDVCSGGRCFVCGVDPARSLFNDEHVLPDWLLRMFKLHERRITLPNLSEFRYGQYKVPCCIDCNQQMGALIEEPVRRIVAGGFAAVQRHVATHGPVLLYTWLSLIFLKTHLRDRAFRVHLDRRVADDKISDWYDWAELHHVHCVARSFHSRAAWGPGVLGSLAVLQARVHDSEDAFDYADLYGARTVLVRMNDICLIAVLNDSGSALGFVGPNDLSKIDAPPIGIQTREVMARMALINMKLKNRPQFRTAIDATGFVRLVAEFPKEPPQIEKIRRRDFGLVLYGALQPGVSSIRDKHGKLLGPRVKRGEVSFLYDDHGKYIRDLIVPITPSVPKPKRPRRTEGQPLQ